MQGMPEKPSPQNIPVFRNTGAGSKKVFVVQPGANLDPGAYRTWERQAEMGRDARGGEKNRPLRLVFVGKYWNRKGLDRLLDALKLLKDHEQKVTLRIIGCERKTLPEKYRRAEGAEWIGFVDKRKDALKFMNLVGECDVGCLLSRKEAGGIALREYHAMGLPVIAPDTGGAPEHTISGAAIFFSPEAEPRRIAEQIMSLALDRASLWRLRETAWRKRHKALWPETVQTVRAHMDSTIK